MARSSSFSRAFDCIIYFLFQYYYISFLSSIMYIHIFFARLVVAPMTNTQRRRIVYAANPVWHCRVASFSFQFLRYSASFSTTTTTLYQCIWRKPADERTKENFAIVTQWPTGSLVFRHYFHITIYKFVHDLHWPDNHNFHAASVGPFESFFFFFFFYKSPTMLLLLLCVSEVAHKSFCNFDSFQYLNSFLR